MLNPFYDKFIFTNGLKFRHNNFFLINLPFFIVPTEIIAGLLEQQDPVFNKKFYSVIKESVKKRFMKQVSKEFGLKGDKMVFFLEKFFTSSGWGAIKNLDLNFQKSEAIVSVSDNPFTRLMQPAKQPVDHFLRGVFAGLFSNAFGKPVDCVEIKCSASGAQNCEFVIRPQNAFDLKSQNTRQQLELEL